MVEGANDFKENQQKLFNLKKIVTYSLRHLSDNINMSNVHVIKSEKEERTKKNNFKWNSQKYFKFGEKH